MVAYFLPTWAVGVLNTPKVRRLFSFSQNTTCGYSPFWDQAGFHTAKKLRPPPNLTLIPLPP